jgi:Phospholipase_D-nuclease N-terminal
VLVRILIIAAVILFLIMWVRALIDVFRRGDLSVGAKAAWAIIMLLIPFIGLLLYYMLRPRTLRSRSAASTSALRDRPW